MADQTVLYRYFDNEGMLLYVGISNNFILRLYQHERIKDWTDKITSISIERFSDRKVALAAEYNAIINENPIYNVQRNAPRERPSGGHKTICIDKDITEIVDEINKQGGKLSPVVCNLLRFYRDNDYRIPSAGGSVKVGDAFCEIDDDEKRLPGESEDDYRERLGI